MTEARALSLLTRNELYGLAQKHNITGRSTMTKEDLLEAVGEATRQEAPPAVATQPATEPPGAVQGTEAAVESALVREPVATEEPSDSASADPPSGAAKPGTGKAEDPESTKGEPKSKEVGDKKDIGIKPGRKKKSKTADSKKSRKSKKDSLKSKKSKKSKKGKKDRSKSTNVKGKSKKRK
jgi:hypothetical protein